MTRALPYPILTVALLLTWMLLTSFSPGQFILGGLIAALASRAMAALPETAPCVVTPGSRRRSAPMP